MKTPRGEIISRILSVLDSPKSIRQVAQECGIHWESAQKYLEALRDAGILSEVREGRSRKFVRKEVPRDPENFFGLPLDGETARKIDSLYGAIEKEWIKQHGSKPNRTFMYKLLWNLRNDLDFRIPMGWYLFGAICVRPYNPERKYPTAKVPSSLRAKISGLVKQYGKFHSTGELLDYHYIEEKKELYKKKLEIQRALMGGVLKEVEPRLYDFISYVPEVDREAGEFLSEFAAMVTDAFKLVPERELPMVQAELLASFHALWRLIALFVFREDMRKFYDDSVLRQLIDPEIAQQKQEVLDRLTALAGIIPERKLTPEEEEFIRRIRAASKEQGAKRT